MTENKRIYKVEFNEILRMMPEISQKERECLNQVFASDLIDGLTEWELNQRIRSLKFDQKDPINHWDAEKVKIALLSKMKK